MTDSAHIQSRRRLMISLALMSLALMLFAWLQNRGMLVGGEIALAKLLWLFYAIFFWFVLPALVLLDGRGGAWLRRLYRLFLVNMCARGLVELFMMYVSLNWHPHYGIAHDLFSLLMLLGLLCWRRPTRPIDRLLDQGLWVICAMLLLESGFAWYLLQRVSDGSNPIYFVPAGSGHEVVIGITWCAVLALSVYLYSLAKRWLYAVA